MLPDASKELDGLIRAAKGIKAGVNEEDIPEIIKYYKVLLSNLVALIPKVSLEYPKIVPILLTNIAAVQKLINGLSDGTATIQDVNESNKLFATILEKAIPKWRGIDAIIIIIYFWYLSEKFFWILFWFKLAIV